MVQMAPLVENVLQGKKDAKQSPFSTVFRTKKFETSKRMSDFKQIKSSTDQVSALMHLTREEFQLEAAFEWKENNQANARHRFSCTVLFNQQSICCCAGQNKQESKKLAAKLAMFKVAPNLYQDLFDDERPPNDQLDPDKGDEEMKDVPAEELTLSHPKLG